MIELEPWVVAARWRSRLPNQGYEVWDADRDRWRPERAGELRAAAAAGRVIWMNPYWGT